jgi:hypothetical protein
MHAAVGMSVDVERLLQRGEGTENVDARVAPAVAANDAHWLGIARIFPMQETRYAKHPRQVLGVLVAAVVGHHPTHDAGKVGLAFCVRGPVAIH